MKVFNIEFTDGTKEEELSLKKESMQVYNPDLSRLYGFVNGYLEATFNCNSERDPKELFEKELEVLNETLKTIFNGVYISNDPSEWIIDGIITE